MKNIEQQALQTYQQNLAYLGKNHPQLYTKISTLDEAIGNSQYKEQYILEYKNEGYFDAQNVATGEWLYGENSIEYSKKLIKLFNFTKSEGTFYGFEERKISQNDANLISQTILNFQNSLWATATTISYHNQVAHKDTTLKKIYKFILINIGLGIHLENVIEKTKARIIYLQEENLELFRLSLFTAKYYQYAQNILFFFNIAEENEATKRESFSNFLNEGFNYNLYIKYLPFYSNYEPKLREFQSIAKQQPYVNYPYNAMLMRDTLSPQYLFQNFNFLNINLSEDMASLSDLPVLIVASGPSTKKEIEWLKHNRDKFVIFSPISTCRFLSEHNIKPNFVLHIDPQASATALLFEELPQNYFDNVIAILSSNIDSTTVSRFPKENVFIISQANDFKKGFGSLSAPTVGEYTYALTLLFGIKNIFLLGIDLAIDNETFATHAGHHPFAKSLNEEQDYEDTFINSESLFFVTGNFKDKVPTMYGYQISIDQLDYFTNKFKDTNQNVYNLSDGVGFIDTISRHADTIDTTAYKDLDFIDTYQKIIYEFNTRSDSSPSKQDILLIKHEIKEASKLLKYLEKSASKKKTPPMFIDYLERLHRVLTKKGQQRSSYLNPTYDYFFKILYNYIFDIFNTKEVLASQEVLEKIDNLVITQSKKIANLYISKLKEYL